MQTTDPTTWLEHRAAVVAPLAPSVPPVAHPDRWLHPLLLIVLCAVGTFLPAFIFAAILGAS